MVDFKLEVGPAAVLASEAGALLGCLLLAAIGALAVASMTCAVAIPIACFDVLLASRAMPEQLDRLRQLEDHEGCNQSNAYAYDDV